MQYPPLDLMDFAVMTGIANIVFTTMSETYPLKTEILICVHTLLTFNFIFVYLLFINSIVKNKRVTLLYK